MGLWTLQDKFYSFDLEYFRPYLNSYSRLPLFESFMGFTLTKINKYLKPEKILCETKII